MKTAQKEITSEQFKALGVSEKEAKAIETILKRNPTVEEVALFCLLWSKENVDAKDERIANVLASNGRIAKFVKLVGEKAIFAQTISDDDTKVIADKERIATLSTYFGLPSHADNKNERLLKKIKSLQTDSLKLFLDDNLAVAHSFDHIFGVGETPADEKQKLISKIGETSIKINLEREEDHEPFDIEKIKFPEDLVEAGILVLSSSNVAATYKLIAENSKNKSNAINTENIEFCASNNLRYTYEHPKVGAAINIANCARELVCKGARPVVLSCGLKSAEQHFEELAYFVAGINKIASRLSLTNIAANVAINDTVETPNVAVSVGGVKVGKKMEPGFKQKGELIFLIGKNKEDVGSSEYLNIYHGIKKSPAPYFDLDAEVVLYNVLGSLIEKELVSSAQSVAEGGIFVALTKLSIPNELGFDIVSDAEIREDAFLYGEACGRVIVSVNEDVEDKFIEFMMESGVSYTLLGHVTQGKMVVDDQHFGFSDGLKDIYESALTNNLK